MKVEIELKESFEVAPETIYNAWLNSVQHSEMTGGEAICDNDEGGSFSAWDGYISGTNESLVPNKEIVQNWRTTEFAEMDEDSKLTIQLKATSNGCDLTLLHSNIPAGQSDYEQGWIAHYFEPMKLYFQGK